MNKAERLLKLLTILRARRTAVVASALAERLGVSERTIYRDVQSLLVAGVPVEGEAGVGYHLRRDATLPPLMFSPQEMEALLLGIRMVQGWGDDGLVVAADSALMKIRSVLPERMLQDQDQQPATLLVPSYHRAEHARSGELIRSAIQQQTVLLLEYTSEAKETTRRRVNPLGLIYWGAAWTLVAWCRLRDDHRLFRLDRIHSVEVLGEHFSIAPQQSLMAYIRQCDPEFTGKAF